MHEAWACVYFSIVTWTTLGYGDLTATDGLGRAIVAAEALNGSLALAIFIALLVPTLEKIVSANDTAP